MVYKTQVTEVPVFSEFGRQRFIQNGSQDLANWYQVPIEGSKTGMALYPAMGRRHVSVLNDTKLVYNNEPRVLFKTIDFAYTVVGTSVFVIDKLFNSIKIGDVSLTGNVWFDYIVVQSNVYGLLTDEKNIYLISEVNNVVTMDIVTDGNKPNEPYFVVAFGNRLIVSNKDSSQYFLTKVNLGGVPDVSTLFTVNGAPLFNSASGKVRQLATLHNQLYIFTDFTTDIWSNVPSGVTAGSATSVFPFKLNSSYNWDYGMSDPFSLSVDFGRMSWLGKNNNGFVAFMTSTGDAPQVISTQAINVLLQGSSTPSNEEISPFLKNGAIGFLYEYENTIFYRVSAGQFFDFDNLDIDNGIACIEFNFNSSKWNRSIELNGERNRIQRHVFFNNKHLVSVLDEVVVYEMAGNLYFNELKNPAVENPNADNAFLKYPFRYELTTQQIYYPNYEEFQTKWLEIDFVFGDNTFYKGDYPYNNTIYLVDENSTEESPIYLTDEDGAFLLADGSSTPSFDDNHYYALFKPHIEIYYSDDGGVTFIPADVREFSQLGQYRWRMRWYQLGASRNRVYKLIGVSSAPIVVLGARHMHVQTSGGAY